MDAAVINLQLATVQGFAASWGALHVQLQDVQTMVRGLPARIPIGAATAARTGLQQTIDRLAQLKAAIAKARERVEGEIKNK